MEGSAQVLATESIDGALAFEVDYLSFIVLLMLAVIFFLASFVFLEYSGR